MRDNARRFVMSMIVLYHGSNERIENPLFGKGKVYNDYGQGFYCTENKVFENLNVTTRVI